MQTCSPYDLLCAMQALENAGGGDFAVFIGFDETLDAVAGDASNPIFFWGVHQVPGETTWAVSEWYNAKDGWICNCVKPTREKGIAFVKAWLQRDCPTMYKLHFPTPPIQ